MNISEHLKKDYWLRRVTSDGPKILRGSNSMYYRDVAVANPSASFLRLTQDDFLNEIQPSAHAINSEYFSKRPVYKATGKEKDGKQEWVLDHYDDVQSVALGLQLWIALKKTTHFAGDGFWIANETDKDDLFAKLLSWKDIVGLNTAFLEAVDSCHQTGDSAVYLYQTENDIDYEVFSYLKGDMLFPDYDEDRNPMLYRKYTLNGKEAVDIFTVKSRQTWVKVDDSGDTSWFNKMKNWVKVGNGTRSEDGYMLISESKAQTADVLQVIYFRTDDIPSGPAEGAIETLEESCSFMSEEVKNSAFPILLLKAQKITALPPSDVNGKTIGIKGSADTLAHSDAKFLTPPDASNIAEININTLTENILRTTSSVEVSPEILKSGADSSTTIKIMYTPEIQWCKREWVKYFKQVKQLVEVFKRLVGKVEGQVGDFAGLRVSVGQNIYIPQNDQERTKIVLDKVYARVLSRKAAMTELESPYVGDYEQINKEWREELDIKARVPAEAKAQIDEKYGITSSEEVVVEEEGNPNKTPVDNNSKGKTIQE